MENEKPQAFIAKYWEIISAACFILFVMGGLYNDNKVLSNEVKNMKYMMEEHLKDAEHDHNAIMEKQDRKWGDIPEIEQRVDDLEEWKSFIEGQESKK